ncbi:unnamed protein product [Ectocarpus sp. 12 AP-2014]
MHNAMTSRPRERVGGGQTTQAIFTKPVSTRAGTPMSTRSQAHLPQARAQTANLPQPDRTRSETGTLRATTARARDASSRRRAGDARSGIFLPQVKFEADENSKFYTASSVCTLSRIFSDSSLIQPSWSKVATSPWGEAARVTGGYGERLLNGANSVESPDFMLSKRFGGHVANYSFKRRPRPFAYNGEANTAVSCDTPKFFRARHTQASEPVHGRPIEKIDKPRLLKMHLGRQIIAEPEVPESDLAGGPLDWGGMEVTGSRVPVPDDPPFR